MIRTIAFLFAASCILSCSKEIPLDVDAGCPAFDSIAVYSNSPVIEGWPLKISTESFYSTLGCTNGQARIII